MTGLVLVKFFTLDQDNADPDDSRIRKMHKLLSPIP